MATAIVCVRSQKSKGSSRGNKFGGPDTYVAVQVVPDGVEPLKVLNARTARLRGIRIVRFGEGYSERTGPRSMLGQAMVEAGIYARSYNAGEVPQSVDLSVA